MRPWIAVAYSAPVAAATAVFLIYPIGQGSFSDGYTKYYRFVMVALLVYWYIQGVNSGPLFNLQTLLRDRSNPKIEFYLKGEHPNSLITFPSRYFKINDRTNHKINGKVNKRNVTVNGLDQNTKPQNTSGDGVNNGGPNKEEDNPLLKNISYVRAKQRRPRPSLLLSRDLLLSISSLWQR